MIVISLRKEKVMKPITTEKVKAIKYMFVHAASGLLMSPIAELLWPAGKKTFKAKNGIFCWNMPWNRHWFRKLTPTVRWIPELGYNGAIAFVSVLHPDDAEQELPTPTDMLWPEYCKPLKGRPYSKVWKNGVLLARAIKIHAIAVPPDMTAKTIEMLSGNYDAPVFVNQTIIGVSDKCVSINGRGLLYEWHTEYILRHSPEPQVYHLFSKEPEQAGALLRQLYGVINEVE
ncbi:MAG: hypothetical protein KatS3mg087_2121 [Patescibacteria group bacterium]|nr:MAG: hypothetical protein KatS3mg087_2121 [Patescibacteria group bacterium]